MNVDELKLVPQRRVLFDSRQTLYDLFWNIVATARSKGMHRDMLNPMANLVRESVNHLSNDAQFTSET